MPTFPGVTSPAHDQAMLFAGDDQRALRRMRMRGLAAFVLFFALSTYHPPVWTGHLLRWQFFDLSHPGTATGALVGILVYECIGYFYHRGMHASDLLWRGLHQMHHSAERIDAGGNRPKAVTDFENEKRRLR
jgi:sterol desaturase/sphingolipid hydroxylase (fatty acid hydroxylase superfamily)